MDTKIKIFAIWIIVSIVVLSFFIYVQLEQSKIPNISRTVDFNNTTINNEPYYSEGNILYSPSNSFILNEIKCPDMFISGHTFIVQFKIFNINSVMQNLNISMGIFDVGGGSFEGGGASSEIGTSGLVPIHSNTSIVVNVSCNVPDRFISGRALNWDTDYGVNVFHFAINGYNTSISHCDGYFNMDIESPMKMYYDYAYFPIITLVVGVVITFIVFQKKTSNPPDNSS